MIVLIKGGLEMGVIVGWEVWAFGVSGVGGVVLKDGLLWLAGKGVEMCFMIPNQQFSIFTGSYFCLIFSDWLPRT